ncbi:MAG: phage holin family protein [Sideroxydans sp.]
MNESSGLLASVKRLAGTLLGLIQTRFELLANEIEEERLHIWQMLFFGSLTLFFGGLTVVLLTTFVVVLFWNNHHLWVLAMFTGLYLLLGLLAWNTLRRLRSRKSKLFATSLGELNDDREHLEREP